MESKINQFVSDQILVDQVETGFNLFLKHRPDLKQANFETAEAEFFKIIDTIPAKYLDEAAKFYIKLTGKLNNNCVLKRVFAYLHSAVNKHKIEPRAVCDAVLKSEYLTYENSALWIVSFQLVRQIVGGVDYKGVREIMKLCIEKALGLPTNIDKSLAPQLEALKEVLEYIFNRNASRLPGYFIVNEILKSYPDTSHWPHWSLVPLVSKFVDSFRPAAAIVSCVNLQHLFPVVEYMGRANVMSTWKLEHSTLKFLLKMTLNTTTYDRILPYSKEYFKPQPKFLRYLLTQTYSRDLINHVLSLKKPTKETPTPGVCIPLQSQVVHCLLELMRACEQELYPPQLINHLFRLLSSNMIFFVLYQYITFPSIISELADGIQAENLRKGRDKLMLLLLQFISGSIQKNPSQDFVEVLRLFSMYSESTPLPVPSTDSTDCIEKLAAAGIYIHIKKKALVDKISFGFRLPVALVKHLEYLETTAQHPVSMDPQGTNYIVPLLCNSFSTTQDLFQAPMLALVEAVGGSSQSGGGVLGQNGTTPMPGVHVSAALPVQPLHMDILDSLSVHSKMSLLHHIVTHILKMATAKSTIAISPGMVETYSRLLVYSELETLGIKSFLDKVITKVFHCQAWAYLYTLLEIFSYRVHHVQAHYRLSLLTTLHQMSSNAPNHAQLTLMLESSALRLITGMGNYEMNSPKPQPGTTAKPNYTLYGDSEELNRMVILTLARTIHIGGLDNNSIPWLKEVVTGIMQSTPHSLPSHTLKHFPQTLLDLVNDMPPHRDNNNQIKRNVDEDWNLWNQLTNEQEKINHFSQPNTNATFLCLLWKMIMESDESARNIPVAAYKVLERTGAKQLAAHLRTFCDYLVLEFSKSTGGGHVTKAIDATNTMIWKYNVITLDRFVLSMVLRPHEGNEAQVCFFIIQVLLLKPVEFRTRVNEVCRTMLPDHHLQQNWHEKHMEIHNKFPEQFSLELAGSEEALSNQSVAQPTHPP
jgi:mediator of RNA polymerase II transcription subunit 23